MPKEYLERLRKTIEHLHRCDATHFGSCRVKEVLNGKVLWEGTVETFNVKGHPAASQCFAWNYHNEERTAAFLNIPPINSPADAVRTHIISEHWDR